MGEFNVNFGQTVSLLPHVCSSSTLQTCCCYFTHAMQPTLTNACCIGVIPFHCGKCKCLMPFSRILCKPDAVVLSVACIQYLAMPAAHDSLGFNSPCRLALHQRSVTVFLPDALQFSTPYCALNIPPMLMSRKCCMCCVQNDVAFWTGLVKYLNNHADAGDGLHNPILSISCYTLWQCWY